MRTASWTDSVSVLDRVTAVFDAFGEDDEGLGVSELARRANLPKSTVSRIAADLVAQRFLDRDGELLYLGVRLFELGQTVPQPRMLRRLALPVMRELRDVTAQTVQLAVLDGADVVVVAVLRVPSTLEPATRVGGRHPAHASALGKSILAFSPPETVTRIASGGLTKQTPHTIDEPAALLRELADVRRRGVATEHEECTIGVAAAAGALLVPGEAPSAAIAVTGPVDALFPDRVAPAVRAAAVTLSRRLAADRAG
ncbi:MAG TPA: IclR family transcriptional regulator [Microbacterium sp.]|jgi:DNA-binding IclR family transcriptional regulator|uniref:IclR family transcriptional regulator n=1 Tax=Microbacterium sp. TaxID=51671 RepID=UPI002F93FDD9